MVTICTLALPVVDRVLIKLYLQECSGQELTYLANKLFPLLFLTVIASSFSNKIIKLYLENNVRTDEGGLNLPTKPLGAIREDKLEIHNAQLFRDALYQLRLAKNTIPKKTIFIILMQHCIELADISAHEKWQRPVGMLNSSSFSTLPFY